MSDYKVEIEGKYNLEEINKQIRGEEAGASEFKSSEILPVLPQSNGVLTNIVTFGELRAGTLPKPLKVINQNDPQPPGTKKVWFGVMIVSGTNTTVAAYREL